MTDFFIFGLKYCGTKISEDTSRVVASVFFNLTPLSKFIKCLFELDWILYIVV